MTDRASPPVPITPDDVRGFYTELIGMNAAGCGTCCTPTPASKEDA
ncbi:MAG: hypothetical protein FJ029_08390 [Actinobacteria bacterium]|nr:hypothetical protein [Actinomycetota bacterium]